MLRGICRISRKLVDSTDEIGTSSVYSHGMYRERCVGAASTAPSGGSPLATACSISARRNIALFNLVRSFPPMPMTH